MKIGIDARFIGPEGTGIGKYTQKLIENLQTVDGENQYLVFLKKANWSLLKLTNKNFSKVLADVTWYSWEEQIKMTAIFKSQNLDILHVPHFNVPIIYNRKFVVTIHDLIHLNFPETSTTTKNIIIFKTKRLGFKKIINHAIKKSSRIITPSKFVKGEIVNRFHVDPSKITVTYEAAEEEYLNRQPSTVNRQPFLLYVGNAYPHKNLNNLLDAFKLLVDSPQSAVHRLKKTVNSEPITDKLTLVIVCPRDVFWQRLEKEIGQRNLEGSVKLTGYKKTSELIKLFSRASAYVFPSLSEGFGIPGLNAMVSKVPVVCSDIPTFKEIYGDAAAYFDLKDPNDIAKKIKKVLSDSKTRSDLVRRGRKRVKKYSWQKMAKQTLKIYERL